MALPAFDTHAYVKRLVQAGFNEKQAEAQAELQSQVLSTLVTEKLATKSDIAQLENKVDRSIARLENKIDRLLWLGGLLFGIGVAILACVITPLLK